ncbi:MAG: recombinase family protein [Hyphomicrobium sp.]
MVGYARVSTQEQNLEPQMVSLRRAGCERVFCDAGVSGTVARRPALRETLKELRANDILVVWRLDRLGRSLRDLISLIGELERRDVEFRSLCEAIDTLTAPGRLMFHVLRALAEFERALIKERTTAGLAAGRARGKMLGRPAKLSDEQVEEAAREVSARRSLADIATQLSTSTSTLRRALSRRRNGHWKRWCLAVHA